MSTVNFFKSNNQFKSQHVRYNPPPQITYNNTTVVNVQAQPQAPVIGMPTMPAMPVMPGIAAENVTVNNKDGGWQAFLGGLLGSVAGGIAGKAIEGKGDAQPKSNLSDADQLKNLKTLFPNHTFVAEGDGKFTCKTPDGKIISGTYSEILDQLKEPSEGVKDKKVEPKKDEPKPDENPVKYPNASTASDVSGMKGKATQLNDLGYANSDIQGTVSDMKYKDGADKTKDFPQTISVKTSGGKSIELTFSKMDGNQAVYTSKGQEYRLENGANGPEFIQKEGDAGYGAVNYHRTEL